MTPDTDAPVEHRQTIGTAMLTGTMDSAPYLPRLPYYRRECSCGHRGFWLRNPEKVAPCPRAQEVLITLPLALEATLRASIEAAERGALPVQKRKAAEREARIESLRGHLLGHALRLAERLANGQHSCLVPESGTGKAMVEIHDELKALGAEEE